MTRTIRLIPPLLSRSLSPIFHSPSTTSIGAHHSDLPSGCDGSQCSPTRRTSLVWEVVKCPNQLASVACGFYVMMFVRGLIKDQTILSKNNLKGKSTYMKAETILSTPCNVHDLAIVWSKDQQLAYGVVIWCKEVKGYKLMKRQVLVNYRRCHCELQASYTISFGSSFDKCPSTCSCSSVSEYLGSGDNALGMCKDNNFFSNS
ncbi:hypothetical protein Vadar_019250 [Vaccinium darrowii]|nr:hypothetical protein Vadar_019250 [Vaccinium darrowii]